MFGGGKTQASLGKPGQRDPKSKKKVKKGGKEGGMGEMWQPVFSLSLYYELVRLARQRVQKCGKHIFEKRGGGGGEGGGGGGGKERARGMEREWERG
jgi:hypothetical protein